MRRLAALLLIWAGLVAGPAFGQRLIAATSDPEVSIDSTFSGESITLFGAIEPELGASEVPAGTYHIIIAIRGPSHDRVARLKERVLGVWLNRQQAVFKNFPAYFWIVSSAPVEQITDAETLDRELLTFESQTRTGAEANDSMTALFGTELVRLMQAKGLFGSESRAVQFLSDRLYQARIDLPAFVPNGNFLSRTMLFRDGELVASKAQRFTVRTAGLDRFVVEASRNQSLAYGLACVLLALGTGWLSGAAFRR
ncbi:MAG: TIGR02186 family protein [Cucumibacter sp.]